MNISERLLALLLLLFLTTASLPSEAAPEEILKITITPTPAMLPADGGTYESIALWLSTPDGLPTIAKSNVTISLTSSNLTVGSVESSIVIKKGSILSVAKFMTTSASGSAIVTASSPGFLTSSSAIKAVAKAKTPARLAIYASPPSVPGAVTGLDMLVIEILALDGTPATSQSHVLVVLSSNNTAVGTTPPSVIIPAGTLFLRTTLTRGEGIGGVTNITAQANSLLTASTLVKTFNYRSDLAIDANPKALKVGERAKLTVRATSLGQPISGATLNWRTTSGSLAGASTLTDANGTASAEFVMETAQDANISAIVTSRGYEPKEASITVRAILEQLSIQLLSPRVLNVSQQAEVRAIVTIGGKPASGVKVDWSADKGNFEVSSSTTDNRGTAVVNYTPDKNGTATITASVSREGAATTKSAAPLIIVSPGSSSAQASAASTPFGFDIIYVILPLVAVFAVLIIFIRRRRRATAISEKDEYV